MVIDVKVTGDVHVDEIIVHWLPSSGVGTIGNIAIIPVVDVLHRLALIWGMMMTTMMMMIILALGSIIKVDLDKFGQMGPADRRASVYLINLGARDLVRFVLRIGLHDGEDR